MMQYISVVILSEHRNSYLKYKPTDREQKIHTGMTEDERTLMRFLKKEKQKADPKKRFCPICNYESGDIVELVFIDGELSCPTCGYKGVETMKPPLLLEGELKSGNIYVENPAVQLHRHSLTSLANRTGSGRYNSRRRRKRNNLMEALHSINKINPYDEEVI